MQIIIIQNSITGINGRQEKKSEKFQLNSEQRKNSFAVRLASRQEHPSHSAAGYRQAGYPLLCILLYHHKQTNTPTDRTDNDTLRR